MPTTVGSNKTVVKMLLYKTGAIYISYMHSVP